MQEKSIISQILETEIPEDLYHYTSSDGLMGILGKKRIWTTDIHYMNDGSELQLGFKYIREEIEFQKKNKIRNRQDLDKMIETLDNIERVTVGITSFTAKGDLLSQWRGYCKVGNGYSLCFDGKKLRDIAQSKFMCYLVPCKYEEDEHKLMVKELVSSTSVNEIPQKLNPNDPPLQQLGFGKAVLLIAPMIKAKCFEDEEEWRLIWGSVGFGKDAQFRPGNFSLIPYWEFNPDLKNTLKSIIIGPTPEPTLSYGAVSGLVMKAFSLKFPEAFRVGITVSEIPWKNI